MAVLSPKQIYALARSVGFNRGKAVTMTAIALAESGGNTDATNVNKNGSVDTGLWQINSVHGISGNLKDPETNARAAKTVYDEQGFGAWVVFTTDDPKRSYQRKLPEALTASSQVEGTSLGDILRAIPTAAGTLTDVGGDVAKEAAGNITDPLQAIGQIGGLMARAGTFLTDPQNWLRIAYVALGAAMVIGGLLIVARPVVEPAVKVAGKAADIAL